MAFDWETDFKPDQAPPMCLTDPADRREWRRRQRLLRQARRAGDPNGTRRRQVETQTLAERETQYRRIEDAERRLGDTGTLLSRVRSIKLYLGCADCGYAGRPEALDFDHLPEMEKCFDISTGCSKHTWEEVKAEMSKCEVVCANCHRVRTADRRLAIHALLRESSK